MSDALLHLQKQPRNGTPTKCIRDRIAEVVHRRQAFTNGSAADAASKCQVASTSTHSRLRRNHQT
eukprot:362366-Chlamydomonas_euryale.AAC.5